ncbi:MAG: HpcH/HpaI aldolase, partial [Ramlibacter sp.]|nr:HpcH/HpaI aldolase [Ramlibacter sp.]
MQMQNRIRQRLAEGETVTGMILFTGSPMMIEMMAAADVDFVIIDMEHSALDLDRAAHCIRAADASGVTPFVRVPEVDSALIKKLLNLGAAGIALPHANRENCAKLLNAMRYAPEGERGACPMVRAAGYTRGDWNAYATRANR